MKPLLALLLVAFTFLRATAAEVTPIPDTLRTAFALDPFYQKVAMVRELPVVGSAKVTDFALKEAAWIVAQELAGREDLIAAMASQKVHVAVMAHNEYTTDIPEHAGLTPKIYWDRRARGLGASPEAPAVSCGEENLLCYPGDPYDTENILIHEFAHAIHDTGLNKVDPTFDGRLQKIYASAMAAGKWKDKYAATNRHEYWAEAVQSWFGDNRENDASHNHVNTRAELIEYDPDIAALCREVFRDNDWQYVKPARRDEAGRAHLAGYDPASAPVFQWRDNPVGERPRVSIQTSAGDIEVELDAAHAPETVKNFLRYVTAGYYRNGRFFRTVRDDNQPGSPVKIAVIQASSDPAKENQLFPAIPLERTRDTGLKHADGTISMARDGPDTAQENFFFCLGDQPELDFGGKRNPDGQGFAAFGHVVKGMDVVRKINALPADGQQLKEPVTIYQIFRLE